VTRRGHDRTARGRKSCKGWLAPRPGNVLGPGGHQPSWRCRYPPGTDGWTRPPQVSQLGLRRSR